MIRQDCGVWAMECDKRALPLPRIRRILTLFDLVEPEGTERGCSWPFVPFLDKKSCLGPSRILGLASLISTNDNLFAHATTQQQRVLCALRVQPHLIYSDVHRHQTRIYLCPFGSAVRSSLKKKGGPTHVLPLPTENWFSRAA